MNPCIWNILTILSIIGMYPYNAQAQGREKMDSLFFNPYTDSLKKGVYNYINVDARFKNGKYLPMDSTELHFSSTVGYFKGNSLYLSKNITVDSVVVSITWKAETSVKKQKTFYIKKVEDQQDLPTTEELLERWKKSGNTPRKNRKSRNYVAIGMVKKKVLPLPDVDSTQIFPPQCSVIFLAMVKPIPVPSNCS